MSKPNKCCYIRGLSEDTDRFLLKNEFSKFGDITKIYVDGSLEFAKVYYQNIESCKQAVNTLRNNLFGWQVTLQEENYPPRSFGSNSITSPTNSTNMNYYDDDFEVENSEKLYSIHGHYIPAFGDGMGNVFVSLEDIRKSGFAVYKREDFDISPDIKRKIVLDDFYFYMLCKATDYLKENRELGNYIDEEHIVNTIERCRKKLLGDDSNRDQQRSINQTPSNNFIVTVPNYHTPRDKSVGHRRDHNEQSFASGYNSFKEPFPNTRQPRNLPNNFTPTHTQRSAGGARPTNFRQPRDNRNNAFTRSRDYRNNTVENTDRQPRRQNSSFRHNNQETEELWDTPNRDRKQESHHQNNRDGSGYGQKRHFEKKELNVTDAVSVTSDTSDKAKAFLKSIEERDPIDKVKLETGTSYVVQVVEVEMEKTNICWVQEIESSKQLEELMLDIMEEVSELEVITDKKVGQLGLAEFEDIWCRCRITRLDPLNAIFIDYGNRNNVKEVKILPDKFRKVPALASRMVISKISTAVEVDMKMKITVRTKYQDDTYLVDLEQVLDSDKEDAVIEESKPQVEQKTDVPALQIEEKTEDPIPVSQETPNDVKPDVKKMTEETTPRTKEKCYFNIPKPISELKNGDKVMLVDVVDTRIVVKTKDGVQKSKVLLEYIKQLDKTTLMLTQSVKEGQIVLCCKDGLPNLCRAVVTKSSPTMATVKYLDYPGEENLSLKSLRNVDEYLAKEPLLLLFTPEIEVLSNITEKSTDFLGNLLETKEKAVVVLTEDNDFDLKLDGGVLLTQKLLELERSKETVVPKLVPATQSAVTSTPKSEKAEIPKVNTDNAEISKLVTSTPITKTDTKDEPVWFDDMSSIDVDVGKTNSYICYTLKNMSEITLISMKDESISNMEKISDMTVTDDEPYSPEITQMCVFLYKNVDDDEASWYRGVVIDVAEDEYTLSMVDFGSTVTVGKKDIRRFPAHLKSVPMLGIFCELDNIPHKPEVLDKIKELLKEGDEVKVKINGLEELSYKIELPEIYAQLKKLKVC